MNGLYLTMQRFPDIACAKVNNGHLFESSKGSEFEHPPSADADGGCSLTLGLNYAIQSRQST